MAYQIKRKQSFFYRLISSFVLISFLFTSIVPPAYAQSLNLPPVGVMVNPTPAFVPVLLKGMTVYLDNPLRFDFIVDSGNTKFTPDQIKEESNRLVKYFLAAMTVPQNDLWVNLSPYEADKIIPDALGKTELGRDMLAQDYILKQLTATLLYPEKELGKTFWDRVYKNAQEKFGTTEIPLNTFNKVWIIPDEATVYENGNAVYIVKSRLKVMLDEDYVAMANQKTIAESRAPARDQALQHDRENAKFGTDQLSDSQVQDSASLSSQVVREIILPEIEREVNEGQNFAPIRQIYQSLILAKWYKETIKESLLSKVYIDQKKIKGVDLSDTTIKDQIYARYVEAFKKGVFDFIKEDYDQLSHEVIPRKYFSGGEKFGEIALKRTIDPAQLSSSPVGEDYKLSLRIEPQEQPTDAEENHNGDYGGTMGRWAYENTIFNSRTGQLVLHKAIRIPRKNGVVEAEFLTEGKNQPQDIVLQTRELNSIEKTKIAEIQKELRVWKVYVLIRDNEAIQKRIYGIAAEGIVFIREDIINEGTYDQIKEAIDHERRELTGKSHDVIRSEQYQGNLRMLIRQLSDRDKKEIGRGVINNILLLEEFQRNASQDNYEGLASVRAVGSLYLEMVRNGWRIPIEEFEGWYEATSDNEEEMYRAPLIQAHQTALTQLYVEMVNQRMITLKDLENRLENIPTQDVKNALGLLYVEEIKQGRMTLESIESRIYAQSFREGSRSQGEVGPALGTLYLGLIEQKIMTLDELKIRLFGKGPSDYFAGQFIGEFTVTGLLEALRAWGVETPAQAGIDFINDRVLTDKHLYKKCPELALSLEDWGFVDKIDGAGPDEVKKFNRRLIDKRVSQSPKNPVKDEKGRKHIIKALWPFHLEMIRKGITTLEDIEKYHQEWGRGVDDRVSQMKAMADLYVQMVRQRMLTVADLENRIRSGILKDAELEYAVSHALGILYVDAVKQWGMGIAALENRLSSGKEEPLIEMAIRDALGPLYVDAVKQGAMTIQKLESRLNSATISDDFLRPSAYALGVLYLEKVKNGQNVSLAVFENPVKNTNANYDADNPIRGRYLPPEFVDALGAIYLEMTRQGQKVSLRDLEILMSNKTDLKTHKANVDVLAALYVEMVKQKMITIEDLEKRLMEDKEKSIHEAKVTALGKLSLEKFKQVGGNKAEKEKYSLWNKERLPYQKSIIQEYFHSDYPQEFIEQVKRNAQQVIENGFDFTDERSLWLAFVGCRINGIKISWAQFKGRIDKLIEFDRKYPGYWQRFFSKNKGLGILTVSADEYESKDTADVKMDAFDSNLGKLQAIKKRVDGLNWFADFGSDKKLNLHNIYWTYKKDEAIARGEVAEKDQFNIPFPSGEEMKHELLEKRKQFYRTVFTIVFNKFRGERSEKYLFLMRDLIIAEVLSDDDFLRSLRTAQVNERINAFKNLYEDYKFHLPQSAVGVKIEDIRGLSEKFDELSSEVYLEMAKVKVIKTKNVENYTLVPQGFLSVFRGRAGIMDCSFDMDPSKGYAFTRALQEDTIYYFVYKGKELKGYLGFMKGVDEKGKMILAVDTVNSPSLDGEKLLTNLFNALGVLSKRMGLSGVALPQNIGTSFNFENKNTLPQLPFFREGKKITVKPIHEASWADFTAMYGKDVYNSIEDAKYVLLKLPDAAMLSSPISQENTDVGGIDMNEINVNRQGSGIDIQFDPVMMQNILDRGVDGFAPVIINLTPINSILPILGLKEPMDKEDAYEMSSLN